VCHSEWLALSAPAWNDKMLQLWRAMVIGWLGCRPQVTVAQTPVVHLRYLVLNYLILHAFSLALGVNNPRVHPITEPI
jgi:hypothetical protein